MIENGSVKKDSKTFKESKCSPRSSKAGDICCKQVKTATTIKSQQIKLGRSFTIQVVRQNLIECAICNLQYVRKNETPFNIRQNNHRKEVKDPKVILPDKHFQKSDHRFNKYARFTIVID